MAAGYQPEYNETVWVAAQEEKPLATVYPFPGSYEAEPVHQEQDVDTRKKDIIAERVAKGTLYLCEIGEPHITRGQE